MHTHIICIYKYLNKYLYAMCLQFFQYNIQRERERERGSERENVCGRVCVNVLILCDPTTVAHEALQSLGIYW